MALAQEDISDGKALAETAERGLSQLNEALAIYRDLGDRRGEASVLWTIGTGYTYIGDLEASEQFLTQAADIAEDSGDVFHASWATYMRGGHRRAERRHRRRGGPYPARSRDVRAGR